MLEKLLRFITVMMHFVTVTVFFGVVKGMNRVTTPLVDIYQLFIG